ncbi:hypothetical protein GOBAR_DD32618 [Gossypium barbadense]|nr:hypothetical protein GOBAR_DD32618 [Gossypium barbadense]
MDLSKKHLEASSTSLLVCTEVIILLSCFNLLGHYFLGLATATIVIRGNDTDQQALLQFKSKITSDPLKVMEFWNSSIHFCQWYGVTCSRKHQRVTKLELQLLKVSGSLSPYIGNLSFLREFNLAGNSFYNQIPQEIGRLRRLEILDLINNSISGEIPSNLSACSKLTYVRMRSNQLRGEIPGSFGLLSKLKFLSFINSLTGSIPPALGNLSSLEELYFVYNALSGILPEALGRLTNLTKFSADENAISGIIPTAMFNLSNIIVFSIGGNEIQGTLDPNLAITMPYVEVLSVWGNRINGEIPISISNASNLYQLQLDGNRLSGNVASLEKLEKLFVLNLAENHLGNGREGLSHNNLSGPIHPQVLGLPSLSIILDLSSNYLTGELPVAVANLKSLGEFHVSKNKLSGLLPSSLGSCVSLEKLFLDGNLFEGPIPSSLSSLKGLEALDVSDNNLSGEVPEFLVTFGALEYLNLSFNNFEGVIPSGGIFKNASATFVEGNRSFGSVYKGVLEASGAVIAVKVLNLLNRGASRSFLAECEALKNIRHRNLVKVLTAISGVDDQGNGFKALVFEFMENGSLEDWLHPVLIGMNEPETARNLNFFQRPSNILLDEEMVGHISDFGLAKIISTDRLNYSANKSSSLGLRGTIGYAAPEYGMGNELSTKGDVYSFGILLLEMFTGKRPTDEGFKEGLSLHNLVKEALPERVTDIIDPILLQERIKRGTFNENSLGSDIDLRCLNLIFEIGLTCSSKSPHERIGMRDVVTKLCTIRDKLHPT